MPCFYTEESKANYVCFHHHYREQNSYDFNIDGITKKKNNKTHSLLLSTCCIYRYVLQNGGQLCLHQGIWDWTFCKWTTTTKMFWSRHTSSGYSTFEALCSLNCLKWSRFSCLGMYNIHYNIFHDLSRKHFMNVFPSHRKNPEWWKKHAT